MDLLESEILYGDELETLFDHIGEVELAVLAKTVFYEELRDGAIDLAAILAERRDEAETWRLHYTGYMQRLDRERLKSIEQWIAEVSYSEIKLD